MQVRERIKYLYIILQAVFDQIMSSLVVVSLAVVQSTCISGASQLMLPATCSKNENEDKNILFVLSPIY